tara:strand:+ start:42 stop:515 length:474 start_codon:yes stop_codon:yes gene_type:complete
MIVIIELLDESDSFWTPNLVDFENWIKMTLEEFKLASTVTVSIRLVNYKEASQLNLQYRNRDYATNVLSFPAKLPEEIIANLDSNPLGDIVICPEIVQREADEQKKSITAHWAHLLVHSALHLKGLQHESTKDALIMEDQEIKVLEKLGFPNPYLVV